ncbi:MAG: hypothetical protein ABEN55_10540, partial [Bradymonadaceae bacterium]
VPEMARGPSGHPSIGYFGESSYVYHRFDGAEWRRRALPSPPMEKSPSGGRSGESRHRHDLLVGPGGNPHVFWHGDSFRRFVHTNGGWQKEVMAEEVGWARDVTLDDAGTPHAVFQNEERGL